MDPHRRGSDVASVGNLSSALAVATGIAFAYKVYNFAKGYYSIKHSGTIMPCFFNNAAYLNY